MNKYNITKNLFYILITITYMEGIFWDMLSRPSSSQTQKILQNNYTAPTNRQPCWAKKLIVKKQNNQLSLAQFWLVTESYNTVGLVDRVINIYSTL